MVLKDFILSFNNKNPDWTSLPKNFPNCDLQGLTGTEIGRFQAIKTLWELNQPARPRSGSRVWKSPQGYKFLVAWSNAVLLRILVRKITQDLPKWEQRQKAQVDDAARSVIANIEEGFKRPATRQYLDFLGYSQASLEEVRGDIERMLQDGFLKSVPKSLLADTGIDLKAWNLWARQPSNSPNILSFPLRNSKGGYRNLKEIKGENIAYEIMIELINKTDWNLRKLVESLEKKAQI